MEIIQKRITLIYKILYFSFIVLLILFGRSVTGVYLFGFRIGELAIGASMVLSLFFLIFIKKDNKYFYFGDKTFYFMKAIIISFFITLFVTGGSLTELYTYKSSSYIWTLSFLFMGMFAFDKFERNNSFNMFFPCLLPLTYIFSVLFYPQPVADFFVRFSDKFDYLKASDVFLLFVLTNIINQKIFKKEFSYYMYLLFSSAIFIPLFLFKSRGAFLPAVLFLIFEVIRTRNIFLKNKVKSLIVMAICIPIFYTSTYNVGLQLFVNNYTYEGESLTEQITASVSRAADEKETIELFGSFFIMDGRLYSDGQTVNWRLQIWQDVLRDLFYYSTYLNPDGINYYRAEGEPRRDVFLTGFGYNERLAAMDDSSRRGTDMQNENVHNFAVNILAKGGFLHFILFVSMYISLISYWYKKNKNYRLLTFITFALMTAFFDVAMESVRFPFIFFGTIAYLFNEK
tara:strand:+ start:44285 stop:45652 length:1368 start_codon:yes stop_codon:yes gene_type:complete